MCGEETPSNTPRVGARVDLYSPAGNSPLSNLLFLNPSAPSSSRATHVRFQPDSALTDEERQLVVSIHTTGDLTKPLADAGLMRQFTLCSAGAAGGVEMALGTALTLDVGRDGIIGRRVSVTRGGELLADGVVGFNFLPAVAASL